jgi:protoporphyrinogen oxidase
MDLIFSNYNYDIIIIGGGITGVFLSYKLCETDLKIMLIETTERLGGRVNTIKKDGIQYEAGAARFHSSHSKLLTLIDELGLSKNKMKLSKKFDTILRTKKNNPKYNTSFKLDLKELLNKSYELSKDIKKEELINISYEQYLVNIFDFETMLFIKQSFGYDSEFESMNAYTALMMFKDDFFKEEDYYVLFGGLCQVVERMEDYIRKKENVTIKLNCSIKEIHDKHVITDKGTKFKFKHLISTIPSSKLMNFDFFKDKLELLKAVKPVPLLRVYMKYKDTWFRNIKRTTTDNILRHVIPIDYDNGLIMITYTDGHYARMWNACHSNGDDYLVKFIHKEIYELFNIKPSEPEKVYVHYWNIGLNTWSPGYDSENIAEEVIKLYDDKEIYVCGDSYSLKQGWIEGCLETAFKVIKKLPLDGFEIVSDLEIKVEERKEISELTDKEYELSYVLNDKKDEWIIMDIEGKGKANIYDIKNWISKHPGGLIIKEGLERNIFYKDGTGISPIDLFKKYHSFSVIEKHFIKMENPLVKKVGVVLIHK